MKFVTRLFLCALWAGACTVNDGDDDSGSEAKGGSATNAGGPSDAGAANLQGGAAGESEPGMAGSATQQGGSGGEIAASGGAEPSGGATDGGTPSEAGAAGEPTASGGQPGPGGRTWPDDGRATSGPLVIEVTTARAPAIPKQTLLWTITVGNTSDTAIADVSVLFRVPAGLQFYYTTHADPDSSACGNGWCEADEEAIWNIGSLAAHSTQTIEIAGRVLETVGAGDALRPAIRLSANGVNPVNLMKAVPVGGPPGARLSLASSRDPLTPGDSVRLDLHIGQVGETSLYEGELKALLPPGLLIDSISDDGSVAADGAVVWSIGDVPVGSTFKRSIYATVADDLVPGDVLNPSATFGYEDAEEEPAAALPISVVEQAPPLSLSVSTRPDPAIPAGYVTYTAIIANTSQRAVENLSMLLRVPAEQQHYYTTHSDPDSSACGNGWCERDEEAVWAFEDLPAGSSRTVSFVAEVVAAAAGDGSLVSPSFRLRASGTNPINALEVVPVNSSSAAQLVIGSAVDPIVPGQTFTYDLNVGHVGTATLNGARLRARLPAGLQIDSISDDGEQTASGEIEWNLDTLPVGSHARRSVTVTAADDLEAGRVLQASARLTHEEGAELDASAEYAVSVVDEPLPLEVSVEATPDPVAPGERLLYTTTITNTSQRAVDGIRLLLRSPDGTSFYYTTHADPDASACGNGYCESGEEAIWSVGTLTAGALQTVTFSPEIAASSVGGSLVVAEQRITAENLGSTINLQTTVATEN